MKKKGIFRRLKEAAASASATFFSDGKFYVDKSQASAVEPAAVVVTVAALDQRAMDAEHVKVSQHVDARVEARESLFQAEMAVLQAEDALYKLECIPFLSLKYANQLRAWYWRGAEFKARNPKLYDQWELNHPKPARPRDMSVADAEAAEAAAAKPVKDSLEGNQKDNQTHPLAEGETARDTQQFGGSGVSQQPEGEITAKSPEGNAVD